MSVRKKSLTTTTTGRILQIASGARQRWHYLYFLLAAFDVITVSASLLLNHELTRIHQRSLDVYQVWVQRQHDFSSLSNLTSAAAAPATDIFVSRNATVETERLRKATSDFEAQVADLRANLENDRDKIEITEISRRLDTLRTRIVELRRESELVINLVAKGDRDGGTQNLVFVTRISGAMNSTINELQTALTELQIRQIDRDAATASRISQYENVLAVLVLCMVFGATFYGHHLGRQFQRGVREREQYVSRLEEAEVRTRSILATAADGIITFRDNGEIEAANDSVTRIFEYAPAALVGRPIDLIVPRVIGESDNWGAIRQIFYSGPKSALLTCEVTARRRDGRFFPVELSMSEMRFGDERMFVAIVRDISVRREAEEALRHEEALRRSEERFRSLVQHASDVIIVLDSEGLARYVTPSIESVFGYPSEDLVGKNPRAVFVHPDDALSVSHCFREVIKSGGSRTLDFRGLHKDGSWRFIQAIFSNLLDTPSVNGVVVNCRDISERKSFEDQLTHQAFHDALTGLPNRALFADRLERALAHNRRRGMAVGVLFLDLDNFKDINDSLGHPAGDRVLIEIATRLRGCVRDNDSVARLGGDEFTVLMEDLADNREAMLVADRILDRFRQPIWLDGREVLLGVSIGIALSTDAGDTPADLLQSADVAVYQAKAKGRGQAKLFEPAMRSAVLERVELATDLRRAVERNEFVVHYQPVIDLRTLQITGVEALARWNHPVHGLIPPLRFIPAAEETGLILPIGREILWQACRQTRQWQLAGREWQHLQLSVNMSVRQLQQTDLVADIAAILAETGLPPQTLTIELTESTLMIDTETAIRQIEGMKALGVRLAIDDFGTGYSSLSYLRQLPIDVLKVDRSFVNAIGRTDEGAALVDAILKMGQSLKLETVAEGVERFDQLTELWSLGCSLAQGFFFAKPVAAGEIDDLLRRQLGGDPFPMTGQLSTLAG